MAFRHKTIHNPVTGQSITFLQTRRDTNGTLLEMETSYAPGSHEPPAHYHPGQQEYFQIQAGELTVRVHGVEKVLHAGDSLHISANVPHTMWNAGNIETIVNWRVLPAMQTEYMLETITGLARDGKTNATGMPSLAQTALTLGHFSREFRLTKPPYALQWIVFKIVGSIARLCGLRPFYTQHLD
jgi:quercetin dioxygenase-like cupin family protein